MDFILNSNNFILGKEIHLLSNKIKNIDWDDNINTLRLNNLISFRKKIINYKLYLKRKMLNSNNK